MAGKRPLMEASCKECSSPDLSMEIFSAFNVAVCLECKKKYPEKYSLLTKSEVKEVNHLIITNNTTIGLFIDRE